MGEPRRKMRDWPVNKRGHRYNPDRTKFKEAMKAKRERRAKEPLPPIAFVCHRIDMASHLW